MIVLSGAALVLPTCSLARTLVIDEAGLPKFDPTRRRPTRARISLFTATTSSPASSTFTCTASTASTRSTCGRRTTPSPRSPSGCRATASRRLSDDRRVWTDALRRVLDQVRRARESPGPRAARVLRRISRATSSIPNTQARSPRVSTLARAAPGHVGQVGQVGRWVKWVRSSGGSAGTTNLLDGGSRAGRLHGRDILANRTRGPRRRHRDPCARARRRPRSRPLAGGARASRLARHSRRLRRGPRGHRSRRAQATHLFNRMPRSITGRPGWPAPCSRPMRSPRRSSATACTCTRPDAHRDRSERPSRIWQSAMRRRRPGCRGVARRARRPGDHGGESTALLADGTIAGSILTMDRAFRTLVGPVGSRWSTPRPFARQPQRGSSPGGHGVLRRTRSPTSWSSIPTSRSYRPTSRTARICRRADT